MDRKRAAVATGLLAAAAAAILLLRLGAAPRYLDSAAPAPPSPTPVPAAGPGPAPAPRAAAGAPDAGDSIRGVVVDGSGAPVPGAEVAAARDGDRAPVRTTTGPDGGFLLPGLDRSVEYLVGARAPELAPVMAGGVRPGDTALRLVLRPGILLHGSVRDDRGRPCAGALVRAVLRYPGVARAIPGLEVRADEDGTYRFVGVPPVPGEVHAEWKSAESAPRRIEPAEGARDVAVDLRVETGLAISGLVRDRDGRALAGIQVYANPGDAKGSLYTKSGEDGAFEIRGMRPRPYRVRAFDAAALYRETAVDGVAPPRDGLEIVLDPDPAAPGSVEFRAVDAEGRPVRRVRILQFRAGEAEPAGSGTDGPDEDGVFRSGQVEQGRWRWVLRAPEGVLATEEFAVERGRATDLGTLRLAVGVEVRGRVLDAEGRPVPEARMHVGDDPVPESGAPAPDGSFVLRGLPPAEGVVRILDPRSEVLELPWKCGEGGRADLGEARLRPARGVLRGRVRSRSGKLPEGAEVRFDRVGTGGRIRERTTPVGADGRFLLEQVPAGAWRISAAASAPEPGKAGFRRGRMGPRVELREGEEKEIDLELD